ncbi:unnamed protein product [Callosobruchus maculatus]|uniref:Peptidase M12B domain-containing protein n=1 Tax=Callosobruchus maculatus TaxID=64391 RepID=A0A653CPD8_CALMS|nr:unnamed protein product [Callosobruchus maculatus]
MLIVHHAPNSTQKTKHDPRMSGCYYSGKVVGDNHSNAIVSLCHGMTGYIHTSDSTYYIEPAELFVNGTTETLLHRMRRLLHPSVNDIPSPEFFETTADNQTVIGDFVESEELGDHVIRKRSISSDDTGSDIVGYCGTSTSDSDADNESIRGRSGSMRRIRDASSYRISNESFVKLRLVADRSMVEYYQRDRDELLHHVIGLIAHVTFLFKHVTIGNPISLFLVNVDIENGHFSGGKSYDMLEKFCQWQKNQAKEGHHDVSILLSRDNICSKNESNIGNATCNYLGVAKIRSMCKPGCAIVQDKGIATSYTIAHELGHVFGMLHDEDKKCANFNRDITSVNIMSNSVHSRYKPFKWSPCSKHYITEFLDSASSSCLKRQPLSNFIVQGFDTYIDKLPGIEYDLDRQCELQFSPGYVHCRYLYQPHGKIPPCEHLYCQNQTGNSCVSLFLPWADGTYCGPESKCFNGNCTRTDSLIPINGGWGEWTGWGSCSRTCGGGITVSERFCDSPKPMNGGSYCTGPNKKYESCNTHDCDPNAPDFRDVQCAEFNGNPQKLLGSNSSTTYIRWSADFSKEGPEDECKLFCKTEDRSLGSHSLKAKVIDGTKCGPTGYGICVNGVCKRGGCDNKLNSDLDLDDCGICGGDNSHCQEITGVYNTISDTTGYTIVAMIPKGSSNLNISQYSSLIDKADTNHLVLQDGETNEYILNGNFKVMTDSYSIQFGDVILKYSGVNSVVEWITSPKNKTLPKDLYVGILSEDNTSPPNIKYRYVIDKEKAPRYPKYSEANKWFGYYNDAPSYGWVLYQKQQWSKCSSICDGVQYRRPVCVDLVTNGEVPSINCNSLEDNQTQRRSCNVHCQLTWSVVTKSACSQQCGKGTRRIYYNCTKLYKNKPNHSEIVNEKHCNVLTRPPMLEMCNTVCNSTRWHYSQWSECSKSCGGGIQRRTAKCMDDSYTHIDNSYCNNTELITEQICNAESCPTWVVVETTPCSAPCGRSGYFNRTVYCVQNDRIHPESHCDKSRRPLTREQCNRRPCGRWASTDSYFDCSVTCGEGVERRKYRCVKFDDPDDGKTVDESYCADEPMPNESRVCYREKCEVLSSYERRFGQKDDFDNSIQPYVRYVYQWTPYRWSSCSQSCGGGVMRQMYRCINENEVEDETKCDPGHKPNSIVKCNDFPCPTWIVGDWSPNCDGSCQRHRQVRCMDNSRTILSDSQCDAKRKPNESTKCDLSECASVRSSNDIPRLHNSIEVFERRYRWRVGAWRQCSTSCGRGTRSRKLNCEDTLTESIVVDQLCLGNGLPRPKTSKACEKYTCRFAWFESYWSPCSATCGMGTKTRNVTCHKVQHGGIIDPVPLPEVYQNVISENNYCSFRDKPPTTAKCILSKCGDQYVWQPDPWRECSHKCGRKGRQSRRIFCVSVRTKQKVPRRQCRKNLKPPRKRKCNQFRCLQNCKEIKHYMRTKENKDYIISLRGRPVQIYCYRMDTTEPQEYISLHQDALNFAEIYDKRLLNIRSCPYDGTRKDDCACDKIGPDRSGMTRFWKVRLNITTMRIVGDDYTFSQQLKGTAVPYGTAGDCYSAMEGCAQGKFSVDLSRTSFKLAKNVRWQKIGPNASMHIRGTATKVNGKCGGYCGNCLPDANIGLAVEIT